MLFVLRLVFRAFKVKFGYAQMLLYPLSSFLS